MNPVDPATLPPSLARFLALWESKRGTRRMPARRDFSHEDLWPWMGQLNLIAVEGDDARIVIFCDASTRTYGREMTGRRVSEFTPPVLAEAALADHRAFMAGGGVPMTRPVEVTFENRIMRWTRLVVPLSQDEKTIDRYFVCLDFGDMRSGPATGIRPVAGLRPSGG